MDTLFNRTLQAAEQALGYSDHFEPPSPGLTHKLDVRQAGGGYIVQPLNGAIRELHIVPHAGMYLPDEYEWAYATTNQDTLIPAILANYDQSTGAVASYLASTLRQEHHADRALAFFNITRVLVDANRLRLDEQVSTPYSGPSILRTDLSGDEKQRIVDGLLNPWFEAIDQLVEENPISIVIHHHTYDRIGIPGRVTHEVSAGQVRPPSMIFQHYVIGDMTGDFLPPAHLERLRGLIQTHLHKLEAPGDVTIDWPYVSPYMLPIHLHQTSYVAQCVYELRKDILMGASRLPMILQLVESLVAAARKDSQLPPPKVA